MNKIDRYNFLLEKSRELYPDTPDLLLQLACQYQIKEEFDDDTNNEEIEIL